jgi:hypothetical protein
MNTTTANPLPPSAAVPNYDTITVGELKERILTLQIAVRCLDKIRKGVNPEELADDDQRWRFCLQPLIAAGIEDEATASRVFEPVVDYVKRCWAREQRGQPKWEAELRARLDRGEPVREMLSWFLHALDAEVEQRGTDNLNEWDDFSPFELLFIYRLRELMPANSGVRS